jgi:hypothetical protein
MVAGSPPTTKEAGLAVVDTAVDTAVDTDVVDGVLDDEPHAATRAAQHTDITTAIPRRMGRP